MQPADDLPIAFVHLGVFCVGWYSALAGLLDKLGTGFCASVLSYVCWPSALCRLKRVAIVLQTRESSICVA